jgi:hypothetical protein
MINKDQKEVIVCSTICNFILTLMSSPNRPAVKSQTTKGQADLNDSNYAETVYRTVIGPDGRVKE